MTISKENVQIHYSTLTIVTMFICVALVYFILFLQQNLVIPEDNASIVDWNRNSFWYEAWGSSGVHKGIDIFARKGTAVVTAVMGIVLLTKSWNEEAR